VRLLCTECGRSVSSEIPEDTVVRAVLVCPECVPLVWRQDEPATAAAVAKLARRPHHWRFYANGTFCLWCGAAIGSLGECKP
jgi:hypothetical protein